MFLVFVDRSSVDFYRSVILTKTVKAGEKYKFFVIATKRI